MNLEKLLVDQGGDPLTNKENGPSLRALINSTLKRAGMPTIDATTPSDKILEAIYDLGDGEVRDALLTKQIAEVKGISNYKWLLASSAVFVTILTCAFFAWAIKGDVPLTAEEVDMIKTMGHGAFDLIEILIGQQ